MELYKGTVVDIEDETKTGIIKCRVNGLYNSDSVGNIPDEFLPKVYPLYAQGLNDFDTPKVNEEVFIILDRGDKYNAFYIGQYRLSNEFKTKISGDYEGFKTIKFDEEEKLKCFYSRSEGLVLELDDARLIIKDSEIKIETPDRKLHIKDGMISLGQLDKSAEPSVLGDKNLDALNEICNRMESIVDKLIAYGNAQFAVASVLGYLAPLSAGFTALVTQMATMKPLLEQTRSVTNPKTKSTKTSLD